MAETLPPEILENWANVRMAHEGLMVDKVQRTSRIVEWLAKHAADGKYDANDFPSDEMGVSIGNKIYVQQPTSPTATPATASSQPAGEQPSVLKQLIGPAIGAGTLAAGIGLGSWLMRDQPTPPPVTQPPVAVADRDWKASVFVSKPEQP